MIFISHRANISGKNRELENKPSAILEAIKLGFDVEIDVWFENNKFKLGHDFPEYDVDEKFLENKGLWCHAKNMQSISRMAENKKIHCFYHYTDPCTFTSKGYIWTYPGYPVDKNSIAVLPETIKDYQLKKVGGICSDYIAQIKKDINFKI